MFIEPNTSGERRGSIEVICGSMFSGKTEELIRRLKRVKIANQKVEIFKPAIDVRYDEVKIVSHDTNAIQSTPIDNSQKILLMAGDADVRKSPMSAMSWLFAASGLLLRDWIWITSVNPSDKCLI